MRNTTDILDDLAKALYQRFVDQEQRIKDLEVRHDRQGFLNDRIATYADANLLKRVEKMEKDVDECERKHQLKSYFDSNAADSRKALEERLEKMEKNPLANFVHIDDSGQAVLDASMLPTFDVIVKSSDAFQKLEKALSEEMARTREMDAILAGVVKRVGYVSEAPDGDFKADLTELLKSCEDILTHLEPADDSMEAAIHLTSADRWPERHRATKAFRAVVNRFKP